MSKCIRISENAHPEIFRRRRFNRRERVALFLAAGGHCAACGVALPAGWHADHVAPFVAGGPTDVVNGQALCPDCNLVKGANVSATVVQSHAALNKRTRTNQDSADEAQLQQRKDIMKGVIELATMTDRRLAEWEWDEVIADGRQPTY